VRMRPVRQLLHQDVRRVRKSTIRSQKSSSAQTQNAMPKLHELMAATI
jgi:hypothetical protein